MIALTSRLNERDETIISLQEEVENVNKVCGTEEHKKNECVARIKYLEDKLSDRGVQFEEKEYLKSTTQNTQN